MIAALRINHVPHSAFFLKAQISVQADRSLIKTVHMSICFLIAQFFKEIAKHNSDGISCISLSPVLSEYTDAIAECAVSGITLICADAASKFSHCILYRKSDSILVPAFFRLGLSPSSCALFRSWTINGIL